MRMLTAMVAIGFATGAAASPSKGDLTYSYTYPAQVRAIPVLKARFDREAATQRAKMAADAAADHRDATADKRSFNGWDATNEWKVVADTPRFLSLSLASWAFTGGAHGNSSSGSLVWDRTAGQARTAPSFFTRAPALAAAVRADFCRQLQAQRREKRGGDAASGTSIAEFDQCITSTDTTVILGSSNRRVFDRIGFIIDPYAAGPYAEGGYEVTVPVTPQVVAAVKPEWRKYFAVGR